DRAAKLGRGRNDRSVRADLARWCGNGIVEIDLTEQLSGDAEARRITLRERRANAPAEAVRQLVAARVTSHDDSTISGDLNGGVEVGHDGVDLEVRRSDRHFVVARGQGDGASEAESGGGIRQQIDLAAKRDVAELI